MKRNLFFLALSLAGYSVFAQLTNTGIMSVGSGTIVSTVGDFSNSTDVAAKVTNNGKIQVGGAFSPTTDATKFLNTYTSDTDYGQLIVKSTGSVAATEKMTQQTKVQQKAAFAYSHISFPFKNFTAADLCSALGLPSPVGNSAFQDGRFYRGGAMYYWNNFFVTYEPIFANSVISGGRRTLFSTQYGNTFFNGIVTTDAIRNITGTPENGSVATTDFSSFNNFAGPEFGGATPNAWTTGFNRRGSLWSDITYDPIRLSTDDNYFRWNYNFGNPYTSNIDLSYIGITGGAKDIDGIDQPVLGIQKLNAGFTLSGSTINTTPGSGGSVYAVLFDQATGQVLAGEYKQALIIKPYETFTILGYAPLTSFTFSDGMKTFNDFPKVDSDNNGTLDNLAGVSTSRRAGSKSSKFPSLKSISFGLELFDDKNDANGSASTFVLANSGVQDNNSYNVGYENYGVAQSDILYTVKETKENIANLSENVKELKFKIQGLRLDEQKSIPVGFRKPVNGDGNYVIKTNNFIINGADDSAYASLFTFFDAKLDKSIPITKDFSYEFTQDESTENRFFIGYSSNKKEVVTVAPQVTLSQVTTQIARQGNVNYLVLGSDVKVSNPTIQVYSTSGQLLATFSSKGEKQVKLGNYAPGVYLIKVDGLKKAIKLITSN